MMSRMSSNPFTVTYSRKFYSEDIAGDVAGERRQYKQNRNNHEVLRGHISRFDVQLHR